MLRHLPVTSVHFIFIAFTHYWLLCHIVELHDVQYVILFVVYSVSELVVALFRSYGVVVDMNRSKDKWKIVLDKHPNSYQW